MDLYNIYYKDLRDSKEPMTSQYSKYYELHKKKYGDKALRRNTFTIRISVRGRSVGKAIDEPHQGRGGNRSGVESLKGFWESVEGDKPSYYQLLARVKKKL